MSPNEVKLEKFSDLSKMDAKRQSEMSGPDEEGDHELIREIRKRIIDVVHEFQEFGEFEKHVPL